MTNNYSLPGLTFIWSPGFGDKTLVSFLCVDFV